MTSETYDYSEFEDEEVVIGDNALSRLSGLAREQAHAEARVARLELELKEAKENLRDISERKLPNLMDDVGMETFTTQEGMEIRISTTIRGSINKSNEAEAFQYLEDNGNGSLIKRQFTVDFGKDEEERALEFSKMLSDDEKGFNVKSKKSVHPQSLSSFVREQLEKGVAIPMETLGVYRQRFSKVKIPD